MPSHLARIRGFTARGLSGRTRFSDCTSTFLDAVLPVTPSKGVVARVQLPCSGLDPGMGSGVEAAGSKPSIPLFNLPPEMPRLKVRMPVCAVVCDDFPAATGGTRLSVGSNTSSTAQCVPLSRRSSVRLPLTAMTRPRGLRLPLVHCLGGCCLLWMSIY